MRPSQWQASVAYMDQAQDALGNALRSGEGVQSALLKLTEGYAVHMGHAGATDAQIEAGLTAGLRWLQKNWDRLFGSPADASKSSVSEKPAGITPEMVTLHAKLMAATPGYEKDRLQAQWDALFQKRGTHD